MASWRCWFAPQLGSYRCRWLPRKAWPLLRRFLKRLVIDMIIPIAFGFLIGALREALVLALLSAGVSAVCESLRFRIRRARYERIHEEWYLVSHGSSRHLETRPRSLRPWLLALGSLPE